MACKATEPTTLDDLPVEMVCEVLRRLSLADLAHLKMTAKRYLQIVSDFKVKQLNVQFHKTNPIDHCHRDLFIRQIAQPTLSHLQQLTIKDRPKHFGLNELNRFTRLVRLKIAYELPKSDKVRLDLPNLRQLELACNEQLEISVNSTKLEKLTYYGDGNLLQVEYPETVISLDSDLPGDLLMSFRNVRHLRSSSNPRILSERTLLDFPDLKEVAYTGNYAAVYCHFEYTDDWQGIEDLSPYLKRFIAKKKALGRTDLKVQFISFELVDHKPIDEYKFDYYFSIYDGDIVSSFVFDFKFHVHNFDQFIGTFPIHRVKYEELMSLFGGRLPDDFLSKFVGIERVEVANVSDVDKENLLWFLRSVPALKYLDLSLAQTLSESFFRRLAKSCSQNLHSMSLVSLGRLQNLDFGGEFSALWFFKLMHLSLPMAEIRWLLNMSWHSKKSRFYLKFQHEDPKTKYWVDYGVTGCLEGEEAYLYRGDWHCPSPKTLKTCSLACLGELAEYFENLEAHA